jgi:hypothetical protein
MIVYDPTKLLAKYAPPSKIEKLMTNEFKVKKTMFKIFDDMDFIDKKDIADVALKAAKQYKEKYKGLIKEGESKSAALDETLNEKAMLVNRVQNTVIFNISQSIKENYSGEYYRWLPSSANEPDPLHQLNYGKTFQIGDGEQPGERFGCQCGMEILVPGDTLDI